MRVKRDLTGVASKCFGTAVLALALVGLQRSLWYFRPQLAGKISPSNQNSVVSTYGSSRKLLQFNISLHRHGTSPPEFGNALKANVSKLSALQPLINIFQVKGYLTFLWDLARVATEEEVAK